MTTRRSMATLLLATLFLYLALALPNRLSDMTPAVFLRFPLELPAVIAGGVAVAGWPWVSRGVRGLLAGVLSVMVLLKLADAGTYQAFSRPFNPVLDMFMFPATLDLLTGTLGRALALVVMGGVLVGVGLIGVALYLAITKWAALPLSRRGRQVAGVIAILCTGVAVADAGRSLRAWKLPFDPPGRALTSFLAVQHARRIEDTTTQLIAYRAAAASDPYAAATGLFDLLDGRDVLVIFIESYGRTSFENPLYRPTHIPTLRTAEAQIADAGLAMASGWLTSPIAGGQSWLAHGTFASGLRTSDQARYGAMLASPRQTLFHLATRAGYRSGAVMPAITLAWPEGPMIGYEAILAADDLEYAGAPFNWITMPDQYTLDVYPRLLGGDPRPDFLQITLISSHAPWVPVPEMIDWDDVGDGQIFDQWALSGDTPKEVWRDRDRVRDQYRKAIDYSLQAVLSFVARQGADDPDNAPLIIVLGDHQPAGFVSQIDSRDVPIHLIAPPDVLAQIDDWGLTPGLIPDDTTPVWPMAAFRDPFIAAFSSAIPAPELP